MHVVGTAGHVDHGKSTLVEALTSIDPDRLREEKEREMTIVLGFAWLTLPNGKDVGIIDVPGHKDFIRNMLAGVGGIDAALLVIAADEGMMPQTREHMAILDLLQVNGGVIALTKTDLVNDPEWLQLVTSDVLEQIEGTCMENASIVPVSARTGQGLEALAAELQACLRRIPERADRGRPRLSVDRAFTIAGFGTVVTGTLMDGRLRVGQEVEIVPSGPRARIRGLQTHKTKIEEAVPGSRVAINLSGVSKDEIRVGQVVTTPGWLRATNLVDVQIRYLPGAPRPLRHNAEIDFFCGAAEVPAVVRLLGTQTLAPGQSGWAQLRLSHPVALVRGDRFILRWLSPSVTVGGGVVVDPAPRGRHRRFRPDVIERLETLAHGTPEQIILRALEEAQPCEARELIKQLTLPREDIESALNAMLADGQVIVLDDPERNTTTLSRLEKSNKVLVSAIGWNEIRERALAILSAYHGNYPLRRGMPREELRSRLQERIPNLSGRLFNQMIARAIQEDVLGGTEASVWAGFHSVQFTLEQQHRVNALLDLFGSTPYSPPSVAECLSRVGDEIFSALVESGTLTRLSPEVVYLSQTVVNMQTRIAERIRRQGDVTLAQVRDMFGTSRKYVVPLLEYLGEQRVTKRVGDVHVLR